VTPRICIALHDVAPATWPQCAVLLDLLGDLRCTAITLLVVPDYHGRGRVGDDSAVVHAINRCVERGAEVALHGYFHLDREPPPRSAGDWLRRRVLTAGEGEFAALSAAAAAERIEQGRRVLAELGWPVRGFVAPAWIASQGTWQALRDSRLSYSATHGALHALDGMRRIPAPALSISTRSMWRRSASRAWLRGLRVALRARPLLRLALHPADACYPDALRDWRWLAGLLLEERIAVTKSQAVALS
jgi:predicted deacetylase